MAVRLSALSAGLALPSEIFSGSHFCQRLSKPQAHGAAERSMYIQKIIYLIGTRTRDLPACSIAPQLSTLLRAPALTLSHSLSFTIYHSATRRFLLSSVTSGSLVMKIIG
jgi:hypothetical protein